MKSYGRYDKGRQLVFTSGLRVPLHTHIHTNRAKEKGGGGGPNVRLQIENFRQNGCRKEPEQVPWLMAAIPVVAQAGEPQA